MTYPRKWLLAAVAAGALITGGQITAAAGSSASAPSGMHGVDCSSNRSLCTEVANSDEVFGHYVGHDEPSLLFDSNVAGSGNQMRYSGVLPTEPAPTNVPGKRSYDFQLYAAFWFGMAMCDTQSYPNTVKTCIPDSDSNITRAGAPYHAGTAFTELQFYPPGYVQQFDGFSCSATQWCVALNIDSLSENPVTGQKLNPTCASQVGREYVNFAYLTKTGVPQGPPNPVNFDPVGSGKPDPAKVAFLNPGDHYTVTMHDTSHGLETVVNDTTTGVVGKMTASAANGFGQVKFAPNGTNCTNLPYDFHPEYSTSSTKTTVPWAAATYNIAIDTEIGHFDYCSAVDVPTGTCTGLEGIGSDQEPADGDDAGCFPGSASTLIKIGGCLATNIGYDGASYQRIWPNGSNSRPSPTIFTSPKTGAELQHPVRPRRLQHRPAGDRAVHGAYLQRRHRGELHPGTADRRGRAGDVLPVLHERARARWLRMDGRARTSRIQHQRLRQAQPVRPAVEGHLPGSERDHQQQLQRFPEHIAEQPVPGSVS